MQESLIEIHIKGGIEGFYNVRGLNINFENINIGDTFALDPQRFAPKPGSASAPAGEYEVRWYGIQRSTNGEINLLLLR